MKFRILALTALLALALGSGLTAQKAPPKPAAQKIDEEYTRLIKQEDVGVRRMFAPPSVQNH